MTISSEIEREYQAIKHGVGFCHLKDRQLIRFVGDDRVSFLHGMCTADIQEMKTGQVVPALFVTDHSHVIADCFIYALADALLIDIESALWSAVRTHLEKFLVADDVEMEELDWSVIAVEGPAATVIVSERFGFAPSDNWRFDWERNVAFFARFGASAYTVLVEAAATDEALQGLRRLNAIEVEPMLLDLIRIEHGRARVGVDTTEKTLALEAGFEWAISYSKGCYIGQETIERATARGGLKRKLCGLRIAGEVAPSIGSAIILERKPVGILTSVAHSLEHGVIGLAILHLSAWNEGTILTIEGTPPITAAVSGLPFAKT